MNDNVAPFLIPQTHTIRQAMEQLEKTEEKIVFVVDEESRLIGSLTDGDIRRWILSDGDLKAQVLHICNRKSYVVEEGFRTEQVRANMLNGNFGCVPVINPSREIVQLLFWKEMFQGGDAIKAKRRLNLPVVIMAGAKGLGLRLSPVFFPSHLFRWVTGRSSKLLSTNFCPTVSIVFTSRSTTNPRSSNPF